MFAVVFLLSSISIFADSNRFAISASEIPDTQDVFFQMIHEKFQGSDESLLLHTNNVNKIAEVLPVNLRASFYDKLSKERDANNEYIEAIYDVHGGNLSDEIKEEVATVSMQQATAFEELLIKIQAALDKVWQGEKELQDIINETTDTNSQE